MLYDLHQNNELSPSTISLFFGILALCAKGSFWHVILGLFLTADHLSKREKPTKTLRVYGWYHNVSTVLFIIFEIFFMSTVQKKWKTNGLPVSFRCTNVFSDDCTAEIQIWSSHVSTIFDTVYSSVPNRRVERNKRAGGKILKKH